MAKIELTSSELLELLQGEIETSELKKKLAKEMLRILSAQEMTDVVIEVLDKKATVIKRDWTQRVVKDQIISLMKGIELSEILKAVDMRKIEKDIQHIIQREMRVRLSWHNVFNALSPELEKAFSLVVKKEFDNLAKMVKTQSPFKGMGE